MKIVLFFISLILLFSCSVQKRKYQKGFYVSSSKTSHHSSKKNTRLLKDEVKVENLVAKNINFETEENAEASVNNTVLILKKSTFPVLSIEKEDSCDLIILRNGDEVSAKVLEISPIEIKYKKCTMPDGPLYVVKKSDVFMIKYQNGTKEVFKSEEPSAVKSSKEPEANSYNKPKKINPWAIASIISAILGIYPLSGLGSILAIIFGNLALKQIKANPEKFEGETLANVGKIMGIVELSILALIFIIIIIVLLTII